MIPLRRTQRQREINKKGSGRREKKEKSKQQRERQLRIDSSKIDFRKGKQPISFSHHWERFEAQDFNIEEKIILDTLGSSLRPIVRENKLNLYVVPSQAINKELLGRFGTFLATFLCRDFIRRDYAVKKLEAIRDKDMAVYIVTSPQYRGRLGLGNNIRIRAIALVSRTTPEYGDAFLQLVCAPEPLDRENPYVKERGGETRGAFGLLFSFLLDRFPRMGLAATNVSFQLYWRYGFRTPNKDFNDKIERQMGLLCNSLKTTSKDLLLYRPSPTSVPCRVLLSKKKGYKEAAELGITAASEPWKKLFHGSEDDTDAIIMFHRP